MPPIQDNNIDSYGEYINPEASSGDTLGKGLWQAASSLGMFVLGQAAIMALFTKGKKATFTSLAKTARQSGVRSAAQYSTEHGNSLTAFLSKLKPSPVQAVAHTIHRASINPLAIRQQTQWKQQGTSTYDKFQEIKRLAMAGRTGGRAPAFGTEAFFEHARASGLTELAQKIGATYARETAINLPIFYGMITYGGHSEEKPPAWYNLPGHLVGMAKFAPEYFAFDAVFRGGSKLFGVARGYSGKNIGSAIPDPIQQGVSSAIQKLQAGEYLGARVGGMTLGHFSSMIHANTEAFAEAWGPNRARYWTQTIKTLSKFERTDNSFADLLAKKRKIYTAKYKDSFNTYIEDIKIRSLQADRKSVESATYFFQDTINLMKPEGGLARVSERTGGKLRVGDNIDVPEALLKKSFFNENKSLPFLAQLLGLRRARGKDFKQIKKAFAYDKDTNLYQKWRKEGPDFLGMKENKFFDNILANHEVFINKTGRVGSLVDLGKVSPRYLLNKVVHSKPLVLFGKVSLADLLGLKLFTSKTTDLPRMLPMTGQIPIDPSKLTSYGNSLYAHMSNNSIGGGFGKDGLYRPTMQGGKEGGNALLVRGTGEKTYSLYDFSKLANADTQWMEIARSLNAKPVSDSQKMARSFTRSVIQPPAAGESGITPHRSSNPIIQFMQEHLALFEGTGETMSIFSRARTFLPKPLNRLISPSNTIYNEARTIDVLRKIRENAEELKGFGAVTNETVRERTVGALRKDLTALGDATSRDSFDRILSDNMFMEDIVDFVIKKGDIKSLKDFKPKDVLSNHEKLLNFAQKILTRIDERNLISYNPGENIKQILSGAKLSKGALDPRGGKGTPINKIKKFIYDFAIDKSDEAVGPNNNILELIQNKLMGNSNIRGMIAEGRFHEADIAQLEYALTYQKYRNALKFADREVSPHELSFMTSSARKIQEVRTEEYIMKDLLAAFEAPSQFVDNSGSVIENYIANVNKFKLVSTINKNSMNQVLSQAVSSNPVIPYPSGLASAAKLGILWSTDTMRKIGSHVGVGWDPFEYSGMNLTKLWAKRVGVAAGVSQGYSALDTIVDTSGLFDWTMFDEGITVGLADQAVRARLGAGWIYDTLGVDNASRYMEGLMPGSTKVIPGAAMGFYLGGIKGAAIGGLLNAAIQPQASEGPLSFLSIAPPLAPFVTDMTKSFDELQDIYEGQELVQRRRGAGWSLGITPIAGGRVEGYEPSWYARLKSQYRAGPSLYGSKVEQFLFKDIPFLDISIGDFLDPQYIEWKHYRDRPYSIASAPFEEVPLVGPVLGATAGRLFNMLHPLGSTTLHKNEGEEAYMRGTTYDWKGNLRGTFGPQYGGFVESRNPQNVMAGNSGSQMPLMSPHQLRPLISEQVYRGIIEPPGLPGFLTSSILWGGDEPFVDTPVLASASALDSFTRTYWDQNLGDMMATNEIIRRMIPRKRTSFEEVNFLQNRMPSWMGGDLQQGDPYCLTPDTLVETNKGLVKAEKIKKDMLLKTIHGRYFPVQETKTREVNEEIYIITVQGLEDFPLKVTGGHPFYINEEWKFAKDIKITDRLSYPLLDISLATNIEIDGVQVHIDSQFSYLLGLLSRWCTIDTAWNKVTLRSEIPSKLKQQIEKLISIVFDTDLSSLNSSPELKQLLKNVQKMGPSIYLFNKDLPIILNYLKAFLVPSETNSHNIIFRMHTKEAAYFIWSTLLQNKLSSKIQDRDIIIEGTSASEIAYYFDINIKKTSSSFRGISDIYFESSKYTTKHGPQALLPIQSIEQEYYKGLVYAIDMGEDESFTIPGALVHNSKVAHGELLLPGTAYESFFNPAITFPTGMSRLGYSPYEQALSMVGLGEFDLETEDILEKGSAIHQMVQNQLINAGIATRVEALISDPELSIRSYVDVMYRDPYSNTELPLEIKSISSQGMSSLQRPRWKHRVQLNAYMAAMNVNRGKFLYISREDPNLTKEFSLKFDPQLWERTKTDLHEARSLALGYLEQGFGQASYGYSYIDRMRALLNAAPYSKEFRETDTLLEDQLKEGYLSLEQEKEYSTLQKYHRSMMRKYELYPHRFKADQLLTPDEEYPEELSSNLFIQPASNYNIVERVLGSAWEYATHLNSPIHTKLIGAYSPEEQYRRSMIRGDFASWTAPIEDFIKPYGRGLKATVDPLQGAISWGTGGSLIGGLPGAVAGSIIGGIYGTLHGAYRSTTGTEYIPAEFKERAEMQEYFDMLQFYKAQQMYEATGSPDYLKEMGRTPYGWVDKNMQSMWVAEQRMNELARRNTNPASRGIGDDMGFGSSWKGLFNESKYIASRLKDKTYSITKLFARDTAYSWQSTSGKTVTDMMIQSKHSVNVNQAGVEFMKYSKITPEQLRNSNASALIGTQSTILRPNLDPYPKNYESMMNTALKRQHNPASMGIGSDLGFGSPWQGSDALQAFNFNADIMKYTGFSALPSWDRPFWAAFLETPEDRQDKLLETVDTQMSNMLMTAWGRGEEINLPNPDVFFNTYYKPSALHPIMDPTTNLDDFQVVSVQEEGLDAHDFGMGWREQLRRIASNPISILPIDMSESGSGPLLRGNLGKGELEDAVRKVLDRMGYLGATVLVNIQHSSINETIVRLNVARAATSQIIEKIYG